MSQYVFILGAGASRDAGAPLMGDFLEKARILYRDPTGTYNPPFDKVAKAVAELQVVHSKADIDLYNLEPLFGVFEMGRILGHLPGFAKQEDVDALVVSLRQVIADTLERLIAFPYRGNRPHAPPEYEQFGDLIRKVNDKAGAVVCSVITFNYDVLTEFGLYDNRLGYDYRFPSASSGETPGQIPLLKLHGSLNWMSCANTTCGKVVPWHIGDFMNRRQWAPDAFGSTRVQISTFGSPGYHCCGQPISSTPVIVPPTWNKTEYAPSIAAVWREAADQLSEAENIFVSGYSLPETDTFFKHLFALGAVGSNLINRFWVFDPDPGVEARFRALLGMAAAARFKFYPGAGFANMVNYLPSQLSLG